MKRGNALIIAIVLLLAVSIFSTGNFIPFANNLSGGAYSIVGNAIVTITGNQAAEGEDSPRILAEHCTEKRDCLSNICRTTGNNRQCIDTIPAEGDAKRGTGRTCSKDSHCTSGKCSNKICGLQRGNSCTIRNKRYCLSNDCFSGECDYSNPQAGNNAGDLCSSEANDDCVSSPTKYSCVNHRCRKYSGLKSKDADCTEDSQCLSGDCTTQKKCATSFSDEPCKQNSDCATNYICSQKRCISKIITPGIVTTGPKKSNDASCNSDNECSSSFCDPATDKCAPLIVAVGGEDTRNAKLNRLKKAIESALNLLKTRLNPLEINHRSQIAQVAGAFTVIELGGGEINKDPETVSEWKTALTKLSASMQDVEDRICEESFKHPEAETEGLPCSLSSRPGLPSLSKPKSASLPKVILPTKISIPRPGGEFQ